MLDLIYNFIYNTFLGESSIAQKEDLALLLTFATIILAFFCLVRLVSWSLGVFKRRWKKIDLKAN